MTGILISRGRFGDTLAHTQGRWSSDDAGRNWSDVAKTQGMVRHGCRHQIWILDSRTSWAFGTLISPGSPPATFSGPFYSASLLALLLLPSNGWSPQGSVRALPSESLARWSCHSLVFKSHRCVDYTKLDIPMSGALSFLLEHTKAGLMASPSSNAEDATRPPHLHSSFDFLQISVSLHLTFSDRRSIGSMSLRPAHFLLSIFSFPTMLFTSCSLDCYWLYSLEF